MNLSNPNSQPSLDEEEPITIRSILNMSPAIPDNQLQEEPIETNSVFISKPVKRGRGRPLVPRTAIVEPPR